MRTTPILVLVLLATACGDDGGAVDGGIDAPIDAPGGDSGTITVTTFAMHADRGVVAEPVAWIAAQDGAGEFVPLVGEGNSYSFHVGDAAGRYGVAIACANQTIGGYQVIQATLVEATELNVLCSPPQSGAQHGFVLSIADAGPCSGLVSYPNVQQQINCNGPLGTAQAIDGTHDIVGHARFGSEDRVFIARDAGGSAFTVDFRDAARSRAAVVSRVTAAAGSQYFIGFRTPANYHSIFAGSGSTTWPGFPVDLRGPRDIHQITLLTATGMTKLLLRAPADVDVSSVPPPVGPTATAVTRTEASWMPYLASGLSFRFGAWQFAVSAGWLDGATTYTYPVVCHVTDFPGACADADPATMWTMTGYKPVLGFVAALPDVLAAEADPTLAPRDLSYTVAGATGSLP